MSKAVCGNEWGMSFVKMNYGYVDIQQEMNGLGELENGGRGAGWG